MLTNNLTYDIIITERKRKRGKNNDRQQKKRD